SNVGEYNSLQLNSGNPVVSYFDLLNTDLKLATCTGNCATNSPTWVITTVDTGGLNNVGQYTSLQLNAGKPVVSYYDYTTGAPALKLATCTANCATVAPTWVLSTVDNSGSVGQYNSLQLNGGKPVLSYWDQGNGDLKLATCTANCATASPTWVIVTVDSGGVVGSHTSLQLNAGNPVVSYY